MSRRLLVLPLTLAALVAGPAVAGAATFAPASGAALQTALATAGTNNQDDVITLAGASTLSRAGGFSYGPAGSDTDNTLTINGTGRTITGTGATTTVLDIFNGGTGRVTVRDLVVNGVAATTTVLRAHATTTLDKVSIGGTIAVGNTNGLLIGGDVTATNLAVAVAAQQGVQADGGTSTIRTSTIRGATVRMVNVSTATLTVEDSTIRDPAGAGGTGLDGGSPTADITVRRTRFTNLGTAVLAEFGSQVTVTDSLITGTKNGGTAVSVGDSNNSALFKSRATIERTTIVGTGEATQVAVAVDGGSATEQDEMQAIVRDSVISGFKVALFCKESNVQSINTIRVERSVLPPGSTDSDACKDFLLPGVVLVSGVTRVDPQFVNPAADDYRPAAGSPLIDASLDAAGLPGLPTTDFAGSARLVDGNGDCAAKLDIGALEFQAPVAPGCAPAGGAPAPGGTTGKDTLAPVLSALKVTRAIRRSTAKKPPVSMRFKLSEAATVRLTFARAKGKRYIPLKGALTLKLKAGGQRVRFAGRVSKALRLKAGGYRVTLTATDAAGNRSKAARALFLLSG